MDLEALTEDLVGYPVITVTIASQRRKVTYQAANNAIRRLVELGILQERTGRRYARIFTAPGVLRIIEP